MFIDLRDVTVRPVCKDDLLAVQRIEEMEYQGDDTYMAEEMEQMFFDREESLFSYSCYVAEYMGDIVGYAISLEVPKFPWLKDLGRIYVLEDYRRNGIGSAILDKLKPEKEGHRVSIEVGLEDYDKARFLKNNGYIVTAVEDTEYDENGELEMEGYMVMTNELKKRMTLERRNLWRAK